MTFDPERAAGWLAEAWESGNSLAELPEGVAPRDAAEGQAVATALVGHLGHSVIGLRYAPGPVAGEWLAGPVLEPRMLRAGTPVALAACRHAALSAGVLGVLAEDLGAGDPVFSALHPVLDLAAERWTRPAVDAAHRLADLNGLGHVLVGKRTAAAALPASSDARLGRTGERPRPERTPLAGLMSRAATEARAWGGLPKGAVLVVAGLCGPHAPQPGEKWSGAIPPVGRITAAFA